ncbi:MAG: SHOCT domain-containing protein [Luteimonas sp.]
MIKLKGWTEAQVAEECGKKYKSSESVVTDKKKRTTWRFASYRARMLSDPVDSIVTVEFVDGLVVGAKQVPAPGSDVQHVELTPTATEAPDTPADRLKSLQGLLDQKLITPEEFENKRKALIDGI